MVVVSEYILLISPINKLSDLSYQDCHVILIFFCFSNIIPIKIGVDNILQIEILT